MTGVIPAPSDEGAVARSVTEGEASFDVSRVGVGRVGTAYAILDTLKAVRPSLRSSIAYAAPQLVAWGCCVLSAPLVRGAGFDARVAGDSKAIGSPCQGSWPAKRD